MPIRHRREGETQGNVSASSGTGAGVDPAVDFDRGLRDYLDEVLPIEYPGILAVAVSRDGRIAYEGYPGGDRLGPGSRFHVASVTKSILSALVGIALDDGLIGSLDDKVLDFYPEVPGSAVAAAAGEATIRHLLTMTAPYGFEDWREPFAELCSSSDWELFILGLLGRGGEFGRFKYSSAGAHLLSCILSRAAGMSAREFANRRLLAPLGIQKIPDYPMEGFGYEELFGAKVRGWVSDPRGNSTGGWGLSLSLREMARIGELYLGRGEWRGRRILPEPWVRESLTPRSFAEIAGRKIPYGYLWWLSGDGESEAFMALGDGGTTICCIPGKRTVVAVAQAAMPGAPDGWSFVKERILPSLAD